MTYDDKSQDYHLTDCPLLRCSRLYLCVEPFRHEVPTGDARLNNVDHNEEKAKETPPFKLVALREVCRALQVSSATIEREKKKGLPYIRIGTQVRFELNAVLEYLKLRTAEGGQDATR